MRKDRAKCFCVVVLVLALFTSVLQFSQTAVAGYIDRADSASGTEESIGLRNDVIFTPAVQKPVWIDQDSNGIADTLDQEIVSKLVGGSEGDYVNVTVALRTQPTAWDANAFALTGGYITTLPWTYATFGFGGQIPYSGISDFVQLDSNVLLVEKEQPCYATVAYASRQIGARPYVWQILGLRGDRQSAIAVLDTGIDGSHPDFSPGFGDKDFTKKIVGWKDQIGGTTSPYDDNGHGSHVSGLAAGNGFFSVDASGNAVATWGANLGRITSSGTYLVGGMMVNNTGTVNINVKWKSTGTGKLDALSLYYGDKTLATGSWVSVASVDTPGEDSWYTLTYVVSAVPSGGYDMYHILMSLVAGSGSVYATFSVSWPYIAPSDGVTAWTGISPQARLVGVKVLDYSGSGTSTGLIDAINWIIANKETYHIVIASMSLGFSSEVSTVDAAVANLVNSGITTVVSAGNSGYGGNYIYTPGSVDEVITVAATNQFDNIASYSSQGGISRYTGKTTKPDIVAPGGSHYAVPLLSADSNDNDAESGWSDTLLNDAALMQGTSMSTPIVAGAASIIIQAMGGFANWQYTKHQALLPKMVMLMTATETFPNKREQQQTYSPTLERGGKDYHEGYGRINLDAAVDALLKAYLIGTTAVGTLYGSPALSDISVLGQKIAWARNVQFVAGSKYTFNLDVPSNADYDLYLYSGTHDGYGQPVILAKSVNASAGMDESLVFTASVAGTFYVVVKRVSGSGTFTLSSSSAIQGRGVAVVNAVPSEREVYAGDVVDVAVLVENSGVQTETFSVAVFYNDSIVQAQDVVDLAAGVQRSLTFSWNTTIVLPHKNYTISAEASVVPSEVDIDNNIYVDGMINVKMPGDVSGDGIVDVLDLTIVAVAYGTFEDELIYNPKADLNKDGIVDVMDISTVSIHYGESSL